IIDYGSGRGYLGVQISHDYDRNVLGIESCDIHLIVILFLSR
ncbi:unnamed protein product, partial [Adineta steineri]